MSAAADTYTHLLHTRTTDQTTVASLFGHRSVIRTGYDNSVILQLNAQDFVSVYLGVGEIYSSSDNVYSTFSQFHFIQI